MPIYQYQCKECGHRMEALQRMSDALLTDCPQCRAPTLSKQLTAAAFKLKGTGWYETDFKNSGAKADKKKTISDKTKTSATETKTTSKVESA